jgi:hypothetical protein
MAASPDTFFVGVNLPWLTYGCDFGANAWQPEGGIFETGRQDRLHELFARLAGAGLRTVRWFVFCDGRAGIEFDDIGAPRRLDACFLRDFDVGLALASRHGLSLMPVLLDFLWCRRRRVVRGVRLGGRGTVLSRPDRRGLLLEQVLRPVLRRYGREPTIHAWDLFNEPEWATLGYGSLNPASAVRPGTMRTTLREMLALVKGETRQPATVGLAFPRGLRLLEGVGIDQLPLHWYDRRSRRLYAVRRAAAGRPVLLGEFPTKGSMTAPAEILSSARSQGYGGALGWSALARDGHSDLASLERAVRTQRG